MSAGGSEQTPYHDPEQQAINRLVLGEVQPALRGAGGLPGLTKFRPGAVPGGRELGIMEQIIGAASAPVDAPGIMEQNIARFFPQQLERATGGFQESFQRDVVPSIINYLTAAGQGRSGAAGEAIAGAGRQALVPLTQGALQSATSIAGGLPLPGAVELSRLPQALKAAAAPREAQFAEESQLRDILLSMLFGQPIGSSFAGMMTEEKPDYFTPTMGFLGSLAQGAGAAGGAAAFMSDRRLKSNIRRVGMHNSGLPLYEYDIGGQHQIGVMADEVERVYPHAVGRIPGGWQVVDYNALPR